MLALQVPRDTHVVRAEGPEMQPRRTHTIQGPVLLHLTHASDDTPPSERGDPPSAWAAAPAATLHTEAGTHAARGTHPGWALVGHHGCHRGTPRGHDWRHPEPAPRPTALAQSCCQATPRKRTPLQAGIAGWHESGPGRALPGGSWRSAQRCMNRRGLPVQRCAPSDKFTPEGSAAPDPAREDDPTEALKA